MSNLFVEFEIKLENSRRMFRCSENANNYDSRLKWWKLLFYELTTIFRSLSWLATMARFARDDDALSI